jgi:hypothetical protein
MQVVCRVGCIIKESLPAFTMSIIQTNMVAMTWFPTAATFDKHDRHPDPEYFDNGLPISIGWILQAFATIARMIPSQYMVMANRLPCLTLCAKATT